MSQWERIKRECFWDYHLTPEQLENIVKNGSYTEKKRLFFRILLNSTDRLADLGIFSAHDLKLLFNETPPWFPSKDMARRIKILKNLLLNEKEPIPELEWKKW